MKTYKKPSIIQITNDIDYTNNSLKSIGEAVTSVGRALTALGKLFGKSFINNDVNNTKTISVNFLISSNK